MIFGKRKKEKAKEEARARYDIIIHLKDGSKWGYHHYKPLGCKRSCIVEFYHFYRWFYFRKSPSFTFEYKNGADIFQRSEIKLVRMTRGEVS
jgi:hypothetical protein